MRSSTRIFWPLAFTLVLADCSTKRVIENTLPLHGIPRPVIDDVLRFTLAYNQGAAFSTQFGPFQRWVLLGITLAILALLARSYKQIVQMGRAGVIGLALVAGGAVGNALDRVMSSRGVVDFIDIGFGATRFYLFNIADAGVSIGAALLAYAFWRNERERSRGPTTLTS